MRAARLGGGEPGVVRWSYRKADKATRLGTRVSLLPHCQQGCWLASKQVGSAPNEGNALFFWTLRETAIRASLASNNLNIWEKR